MKIVLNYIIEWTIVLKFFQTSIFKVTFKVLTHFLKGSNNDLFFGKRI